MKLLACLALITTVGIATTDAAAPLRKGLSSIAFLSPRPAHRRLPATLQSASTSFPSENERPDKENGSPDDTVRVRIWRALASGEELSLSELSKAVGERRLGELRSHLTHVEKQAKTLKKKSEEWRKRRGLPPKDNKKSKMRLKMRKGKKEVYVRLG